MVSLPLSIRKILQIKTPGDLEACLDMFDVQAEDIFIPLEELLDRNLFGSEREDLLAHMAEAESYWGRAIRFNSLAIAFYQLSQSKRFLLVKTKGVTDVDRDAMRNELGAGWKAWVSRMDRYCTAIESRVNYCKKILGFDTPPSAR